MNFGTVCSACVSFGEGGGRSLYSRLIAYLNISPPSSLGMDVVYKMGGRINGTLRYINLEKLVELRTEVSKLESEIGKNLRNSSPAPAYSCCNRIIFML